MPLPRGPGTRSDSADRPAEKIARLRARGVELHEEEKLPEAIEAYQRYLRYRPKDAGIWNNLGVALRAQEHFAAASACYRRALEVSPNDPALLGNLGNVLKDLDRIDEAVAAHRLALEHRPDDFSLHQNLGIAFREGARFAEALEQFDICLRIEPDHAKVQWAKVQWDRALALLHLGRFEEGWKAYEARWGIGELPVRDYAAPRWHGEDLGGKTILFYPEQGFGDTILASRFLPQIKARGARIILECKPPLRRLFAALEGVDRLVEPNELSAGFDYHSSLMSLLGLHRVTPDRLPPLPRLTVPQEARDRMAPLLRSSHDRFRIGIVWSGSVTFKGNRKRSVTPECFLPLAEIPGVQLFSLQKGPRQQDLQSSGAGAAMIDLGGWVEDFAETAAVIEQLDLVIMTDSSVAHLAGALGQPVWDLLNYSTYWLYGSRGEATPWYPSFRLFRQPSPGDWESVFAKVKQELSTTVARWRHAGRQATADPEVVLPSAFRTESGKPRFVLPLLRSSLEDPGIRHLRVYETRFGGFEYATRHFFDQHLEAEDLFIDVGAHWGAFALTAATRWPGRLRVLAIEPMARNLERLRRAIEVNRLGDQIEVAAQAVGDRPGQAAMGPQSTMGHSVVARSDGESPPETDIAGVEVVSMTTIDRLLAERPDLSERPVFIKIDVEGFEPEVMAGAAELIASGRVRAIVWERGRAYDRPDCAAALERMTARLADQGFRHMRFPNDTLGGPLMPYVPGPDLCNVHSLAPGFECRAHYARAPGPAVQPVRAPSPFFKEGLRRDWTGSLIAAGASDAGRWADARCLEEGAEQRASLAALHLEGARRVLDLGSGLELLRGRLSLGATYLPVDLVRRSAETEIADFNQGQFPATDADDAVLLELLEHIHDVPGLLQRCRARSKRLLFTYNVLEDDDTQQRRAKGWFNDYRLEDIASLIAECGWSPASRHKSGGLNLFICEAG